MTGHWDVRLLDPTDERSMRRAWEIGHAATVADRPHDLFWPWSAMWASASMPRADADTVWMGAFDGTASGALGYREVERGFEVVLQVGAS